MPKSRKDKKVSLTRTTKRGMEWKKKMFQGIRDDAEKATGIYAFEVIGMRTAGLRELRRKWRGSKIFLGKNKVAALALGTDTATEIKENLHQLSTRLRGNCGLLFTTESKDKVVDFFENFVELDYARQGNKANETVVLQEGKLSQFPHSIEPHLRSLGLPTSLQRGVITLVKEFPVCKKGQILTADQAKILKLLEKPMAEFRIVLDCMWGKPNEFEVFPRQVDDEEEDADEEDAGSDVELMEDDDDQYEDLEGTTDED